MQKKDGNEGRRQDDSIPPPHSFLFSPFLFLLLPISLSPISHYLMPPPILGCCGSISTPTHPVPGGKIWTFYFSPMARPGLALADIVTHHLFTLTSSSFPVRRMAVKHCKEDSYKDRTLAPGRALREFLTHKRRKEILCLSFAVASGFSPKELWLVDKISPRPWRWPSSLAYFPVLVPVLAPG